MAIRNDDGKWEVSDFHFGHERQRGSARRMPFGPISENEWRTNAVKSIVLRLRWGIVDRQALQKRRSAQTTQKPKFP